MHRASWTICFLSVYLGLSLTLKAHAAPPTVKTDSPSFDGQAMVRVAQAKSTDEMRRIIQEEYGVATLATRRPGTSKKNTQKDSADALYFGNILDTGGAEGMYVAAQSFAVTLDDQGRWGQTQRPMADKDLIVFREDSTRGVLLHEFAHYLIEKRRREVSGDSARASAERKVSPLNFLQTDLHLDRPLTTSELKERVEAVVALESNALAEEMLINTYLLANRRDFALSIIEVQGFLHRMSADPEHYLDEPAQGLKATYERLEAPQIGALFAEAYATEKKRAAKRLAEFYEVNPWFKKVSELNQREIFLLPPIFSSKEPRKILGIAGPGELTEKEIKTAFHHWVSQFPADGPSARPKEFKQLVQAKDDLLNPDKYQHRRYQEELERQRQEFVMESRHQRELGERGLRRLGRLTTRFATQCALMGAAGAVDRLIPGVGILESPSPFFWGLNTAVALFSVKSEKNPPVLRPLREGATSGAVRAGVIVTCAKLLEAFASF